MPPRASRRPTRCRSTVREGRREDPHRLLPDAVGDPFHARHGGCAHAQERPPDLHVGGTPTERGEPRARRVLAVARRPDRAGAGVLLDGGRRGRGRRGAGDHRGDLPTASQRRCRRRSGTPMVSQPDAALWLIPALPLATAAINLFWGRRLGRWAGWLASASVIVSFAVSLVVVSQLVAKPADDRLFLQHLFDWSSVGRFVFRFGTLDFEAVFGTAGTVLTKDAATAIALLLFAGAIGKSAQVPLHVWLPDAMAGPTPVSALIHAATMVTAGVYLVVRSHVLFELSGVALTVVLVVGVVTAVYAATCAVAQQDIKRVLAYSTISQLGFMFMAAGMRAYGVAMFFLVAHAFYKALLFLGAGSVIHGMHDEQDLRQMGGLRRLMPITFATFLVGALAQAGIPPLAGSFAKDAVVEVAQHSGRETVYVLGSVAAFLSAFYLGRMLFLTFFGDARSDCARAAHEAPPVLWAPLVVLAVGAATAGWLNVTPEGRLTGFLERVTGFTPVGQGVAVAALAAVATVISLVALALTWWLYGSG